jgi:hypothetical protein
MTKRSSAFINYLNFSYTRFAVHSLCRGALLRSSEYFKWIRGAIIGALTFGDSADEMMPVFI